MSIIKNKAEKFSVRIVNLFKYLTLNFNEITLSKQLLRSGTSIAANTNEALDAESDTDFIHKFAIAQKECNETIYWLKLLFETIYLTKKQFESMNNDCTELYKIITSIILTKKQNLRKK